MRLKLPDHVYHFRLELLLEGLEPVVDLPLEKRWQLCVEERFQLPEVVGFFFALFAGAAVELVVPV